LQLVRLRSIVDQSSADPTNAYHTASSKADVSANLKGAVSKPACQKALSALAEKGNLTMKMYGKQSVFVYPQVREGGRLIVCARPEYPLMSPSISHQNDLPTMSATELAEVDTEIKAITGDVDAAKKQLKALENGQADGRQPAITR
jgi:26S proteasome regulatory subunit (ATPase 3-interacting protein)